LILNLSLLSEPVSPVRHIEFMAKGNHPTGLNYEDCFAYPLTKAPGQRLLFKGQDFSQTDIDVA